MQGVRRARDPIDHIRKLLVDHNILEQNDLKKMEREIKKEVRLRLCSFCPFCRL